MVNLAGVLLGASALVITVAVQAPQGPAAHPSAKVAALSTVLADPRFGIHPAGDAPQTLPPARTFGVTRLWDTGAIWCRMNPQPGVWDFTPLTSQLTTAADQGSRSVIVVLGFPPAHAVADDPQAAVPYSGEAAWLCPEQGKGYASILPGTAAWDDYVQRTADVVAAWRAGNPEVAVHFQLWNEPAVSWFLRPEQPVQRLVELAERARRLVHLRMPDALLISPPVVSTQKRQRAAWQQAFVAQAQQWAVDNGQRLFDVWSVHAYPTGLTFEEVWAGPDGYQVVINDVLTAIAPGRQAGDQVWITEVNANIAFTTAPTQVLADADQALFVQAVAQDAATRGIPVVVWYRWHYDPWAVGHGQIVFSPGSAAMAALLAL